VSDWVSGPHTQISLFEDVQQAGHGPALVELALEPVEVRLPGLGRERRHADAPTPLRGQHDLWIGGQVGVERGQRVPEVLLEPSDERVGIQRQPERGVVVGPPFAGTTGSGWPRR
jgi:hypothetical protein